MPSAARKTTMPVTRTSDCSKPAEASTSSGPCEPSCISSSCLCPPPLCMDMLRLQNLRQMRIVGLHQRPHLQARAVDRHPEGHHGHGHGDVLQYSPAEVQVARRVLEVGLDQPEQVKSLGEDHPAAYRHQPLLVPLDVPGQQHGEWNQPVKDKVQRDDDAPVSANAVE